ncbi:hypothetical protein DPMN_159363 [Dreissena polymorpha]|uniref:Uncharacterized protein n=1 Tax=Dreissena polymorpha TaxID=45954 RepID=A0A9D4EP94_DREPO|nr:hypothetical protein DPMN_159363 [Dreissena polymorpha]
MLSIQCCNIRFRIYADLLKSHISAEAETCISDCLTILGQVQYHISVRRRYMIRPCLKKKYWGLCQVSMPITTKLFRDDITKEIKNCDSQFSIGNDSYLPPNRGHYFGRGRGRYTMRQPVGHRYQLYQNQMPYQMPHPQRRANMRPFKSRPPRRPAATSTMPAPNGVE